MIDIVKRTKMKSTTICSRCLQKSGRNKSSTLPLYSDFYHIKCYIILKEITVYMLNDNKRFNEEYVKNIIL